jgi:hypothetical protein
MILGLNYSNYNPPWVPDEKVQSQDVTEFVVKDGIAQQHPFYKNLSSIGFHEGSITKFVNLRLSVVSN